MFDMTPQQQSAFQAATNGVTAARYDHVILFFIGAVTTIWLLLIFMGTIKHPKKSLYEAMYEFAFGVGVYIAIGVIIYYT